MAENTTMQGDWVPDTCTLPTIEQPVRRAEFDDLFARDVLCVHQDFPQVLRLQLRPEVGIAGRAASLAVRETGCCSFFTFDLSITEGSVVMEISTAPVHAPVLEALAARARARIGNDA